MRLSSITLLTLGALCTQANSQTEPSNSAQTNGGTNNTQQSQFAKDTIILDHLARDPLLLQLPGQDLYLTAPDAGHRPTMYLWPKGEKLPDELKNKLQVGDIHKVAGYSFIERYLPTPAEISHLWQEAVSSIKTAVCTHPNRPKTITAAIEGGGSVIVGSAGFELTATWESNDLCGP